MEQLSYSYKTTKPINKKIHVGVVGSGDLEILLFPTEKSETSVRVCTGSDGFDQRFRSYSWSCLSSINTSNGGTFI